MSDLKVIQPGILSLPQDGGRYGAHGIGLTTGGPLDRSAFRGPIASVAIGNRPLRLKSQ